MTWSRTDSEGSDEKTLAEQNDRLRPLETGRLFAGESKGTEIIVNLIDAVKFLNSIRLQIKFVV